MAQCDMPSAGNTVLTRLFARQLKALRKRGGYKSAEQFAKQSGIQVHTLDDSNAASATRPSKELAAICLVLGKTPNDLMPEVANIPEKIRHKDGELNDALGRALINANLTKVR